MPTPTRPTSQLPSQSLRKRSIAAAAALYAAAELLAGIILGRFVDWGRAEALLFLAFRPWLLLAAAVLVHRPPAAPRYAFYAGSLLLAALSESLFLLGLGAAHPWTEAARGIAAGALLVIVVDLVLQVGRRVGGRTGMSVATGLLVILLSAGGLRAYEAVAVGAPTRAAAAKPDLMLMTALPLVWGEKGPLDPGSRPAAAYRALAEEFSIRPLDLLDERSLATGRLLFLAQPRVLAPRELAALDTWVRRGGRVLILSDPDLRWPSELPLGDIRRAPVIGLLDPLLTHWGLKLRRPTQPKPAVTHVATADGDRKLMTFSTGGFISTGKDCTVGPAPHIARCRLGPGSAILLADADMLHDRWWVGPGSRGSERQARMSDNPLILADWLDELAGRHRQRLAGPVEWIDPDANWSLAWLLALLPILLAAAPAATLAIRRRS